MENVKSTRQDYSSFVYETDYEETLYFKALKKDVNKKAVFILASNKEEQLENAIKAAKYLSKNRFTVYVNFPSVKIGKKSKRIIEVENKSDEYYLALATSKYIIAQTLLPAEYINRDNQIVINDTILRGSALQKRIARNINNKKSDYFVVNAFRKNGIAFDDMLKSIKKGKLNPKKEGSNKKEVLFSVNLHENGSIIELFERIASQLDKEKYNISLLIDNAYFEQNLKILSSLDKNISIYIKRGKILRSMEDDKKLSYLNKEFGYLENNSDINGFLPEYVFEWERKRLFGKKEFDTVVNIGFRTFYWALLLKSAAKDRFIYIDLNDFQNLNTETALGYANRTLIADEVYYLTCENLKSALELTDNSDGKGKLLPFIPLKTVKQVNLQTLETNAGKRLVTSIASNGFFDSLIFKSVPYFENKCADCIYSDNSVPAQEMMNFIRNIADGNTKPIFVIDAFKALENMDIRSLESVFNITYLTSSAVYAPLLSGFDCCYLPKENRAIQYEAQQNGIKTYIIDESQNKTETENISEYKLEIDI